MRLFFTGALTALVVLMLVGAGVAAMGLIPTNADTRPSAMESWMASFTMDASIHRHAPKIKSPLTSSPANMIEGMKLYAMNCSACHGGFDMKECELGLALYPPAPNLITEPLDEPDWMVFYMIQRGLRLTGMPAWNTLLTDTERWKITAFLLGMEKLPDEVRTYWKNTFGKDAPAGKYVIGRQAM
ncbi:MAG: c-type cytochrome [Spirochaetes bacterium]|nr:c-type cytochrome [Spirochaetota bacterium]